MKHKKNISNNNFIEIHYLFIYKILKGLLNKLLYKHSHLLINYSFLVIGWIKRIFIFYSLENLFYLFL